MILPLNSPSLPIPSLQNQPPGAEFAVFVFFVLLEDTKSLRRVVFPHKVGRVENIAEIVATQTV
jgi:hypothetical protein